jgi:hypothetical protein
MQDGNGQLEMDDPYVCYGNPFRQIRLRSIIR